MHVKRRDRGRVLAQSEALAPADLKVSHYTTSWRSYNKAEGIS
jgi:hypothetical protein